MFFDDYKEIPKQYGQLPNELMLKKNQVLHLSVLVRDKVVASVYLSKWLTNKNLKPFGLELDSIQAHLPVNKTETSSKNNV
jgi:sulfate adenylyltransferase subunit 1 (EFTu-like GTPase family)